MSDKKTNSPAGWEPLLTWTFLGKRFEDHSVDLANLEDLVRLRQLLVETAKVVWKRDNAVHRTNLPAHFEQDLGLRITKISGGSAAFEVLYLPPDPQLLEPPPVEPRSKLPKAAEVVLEAIAAAIEGRPIPAGVPRKVLGGFS